MNQSLPAMAERPKRISPKVKEAIAIIVSGDTKTITDAAAKVGLSREHLSRELAKPHIQEFSRQKIMRSLGTAAMRAGATKAELLDCDNAMVRDRASSFVLGLIGIAPANQPSVNVNIEVKAGYVIDLTDDPPQKAISHG